MDEMIVSKLITFLKGVLREHGDLPVRTTGEYRCPTWPDDFKIVEAVHDEDGEFPKYVGIVTG